MSVSFQSQWDSNGGSLLEMMEKQLDWMALQVKSRSEKLVAFALNSKHIEVFLPLYTARRRWSDRVKQIELPLFDGYVFCRLNPVHRMPVLTIPGVIQIVGIGRTPVPIADDEIQALQSVMRSGLPSMPWPFLEVGQRVRVRHGALRDLEGILLKAKGSHRLVLSVSLLQRSVAVEVDRDSVAPLGRNPIPMPAVLAASPVF
jgi:transcription antitermination factor NusG